MVEWTKCERCQNKVPVNGQCNKCGWLVGLNKVPEPVDFENAKKVNSESKYKQFQSIDQYIDMEMIRLAKEGKLEQKNEAEGGQPQA